MAILVRTVFPQCNNREKINSFFFRALLNFYQLLILYYKVFLYTIAAHPTPPCKRGLGCRLKTPNSGLFRIFERGAMSWRQPEHKAFLWNVVFNVIPALTWKRLCRHIENREDPGTDFGRVSKEYDNCREWYEDGPIFQKTTCTWRRNILLLNMLKDSVCYLLSLID